MYNQLTNNAILCIALNSVEVDQMIARFSAGGKSELHRAGSWVTPSPGDGKESATENIPLRLRRSKGEKAG